MTVEAEHAAQVEAKVRRKIHLASKIRATPFIPIEPTDKQWLLLLDEREEILYGGAVGGAKSYALLAAALMHTDVPAYNALILRRTYSDLAKPGALMDLAAEWLLDTKASPRDGGRKWVFPSGSSLLFGHMDSERDKENYLAASWQFIGVDEVQTLTLSQYLFMFSRLRQNRRAAQAGVPLRMRSTANPGGHEWVKTRFIDLHDDDQRAFIAATLDDNPHLNVEEYRRMLSKLDPVMRAQYEHGDWHVQAAGNFFKAHSFVRVDGGIPNPAAIRVRSYDMAATSDGGDYTVGTRMSYDRVTRRYAIEHVVRGQLGPDDLERLLVDTAHADPPGTIIVLEQEPGSSGKLAVRDIRQRVLAGREVRVVRPTGSKIERARLLASLVANGDVDLWSGHWVQAFTDELGAFPNGVHDDQTDSASQAAHTISAILGVESVADTSAVDTFRRMSVVTSDAARSTGPPRGGIPGLHGPSSSPFSPGGFRR